MSWSNYDPTSKLNGWNWRFQVQFVGREVQDDDGRIRHWVWIEELARYLRVVTLKDGITVHNAFPDQRFSP